MITFRRGLRTMEPLIRVNKLRKYFPIRTGFLKKPLYVHAVDDVSFEIGKGEIMALVGESGSGKTTVGRCILKIIEPTSGEILFNGVDITKLKPREFKSIRPKLQAVFQDPYLSLNPRKTIGNIIADPFKIHTKLSEEEIMNKVIRLLEDVGLSEDFVHRYPHELSGGQLQRVAIARAIALDPEFLFLDEPTSSLDVSVQAQILNLLIDLQKKRHTTYLFVTHNIHLARFMSDRVAVMYVGKIMEIGPSKEVLEDPKHPYSQALLSAVPDPDPERKKKRIILPGDVPTPVNPPPGCRFHTRCWMAEEICRKKNPELVKVGKDHYVACHFI